LSYKYNKNTKALHKNVSNIRSRLFRTREQVVPELVTEPVTELEFDPVTELEPEEPF
jgi:hypothetical protein